jgi:hypothetical protein
VAEAWRCPDRIRLVDATLAPDVVHAGICQAVLGLL